MNTEIVVVLCAFIGTPILIGLCLWLRHWCRLRCPKCGHQRDYHMECGACYEKVVYTCAICNTSEAL